MIKSQEHKNRFSVRLIRKFICYCPFIVVTKNKKIEWENASTDLNKQREQSVRDEKDSHRVNDLFSPGPAAPPSWQRLQYVTSLLLLQLLSDWLTDWLTELSASLRLRRSLSSLQWQILSLFHCLLVDLYDFLLVTNWLYSFDYHLVDLYNSKPLHLWNASYARNQFITNVINYNP